MHFTFEGQGRGMNGNLLSTGLVYTIQQLLVSHRCDHGFWYVVDWEGYSQEECSWVLSSHIVNPDLIAEFQWL